MAVSRILKSMYQAQYPLLAEFNKKNTGEGALGITGHIDAALETDPKTGLETPNIRGISLEFTRPKYARIFKESNGLGAG